VRASHGEGRGGWLASILGAAVLIAGGFLCGLVLGLLAEEPGLVVSHLAGQSEEVAWDAPEPAGEAQAGAGAAPGPARAPARPKARTQEVAPSAEPARAGEATREPARPERTPAVSARPPAGALAVQVGAFAESASAEALARRLEESGYDAYVTPGPGPGAGRWRVRVGPLTGREAADRTAERLRSREDLPTWILEEPGG